MEQEVEFKVFEIYEDGMHEPNVIMDIQKVQTNETFRTMYLAVDSIKKLGKGKYIVLPVFINKINETNI